MQMSEISRAGIRVFLAAFGLLVAPVLGDYTAAAQSADPQLLQFQAPAGSPAPQSKTLTLSGAQATFWAQAITQTGSGWLSVSPAGGNFVDGVAVVTVTVNAAGLQTGYYMGYVQFDQGLVPVFLTVGQFTLLTSTPSSLAFSWNSGAEPPDPQSVKLEGTAGAGYTAMVSQQGSTWLGIAEGPKTPGVSVNGTLPATLNVSVNPVGLASGNHAASIAVAGSDGTILGTVDVSLWVNAQTSGVAFNAASMTFGGPVGIAPAAKAVKMTTSAAGVNYTLQTSDPWIYAVPASGPVSAAGTTVLVTVNPTFLSQGVYSGYIDFSFDGGMTGSRRVPVVYTAGSSGHAPGLHSLTPGQLTFAMQAGSAGVLGVQQIAVTGPAGALFNATAISTGNWLRITGGSGVVPGTISAAIDEAVASSLPAGQYQGTVSAGSALATVRLNVYEKPVLRVNPGSAVVHYDPSAIMGPAPVVFSFASSAAQPMDFSLLSSHPASWLQAVKNANHTITASILNAASLQPGIHTTSIPVFAPAAANSPLFVPVTLVVAGAQTGLVTPATLSFATPAGLTPAAKALAIQTDAAAPFAAAAASSGWLSVTPGSGVTWLNPVTGVASAAVSVSVNPAGLPPGVYEGLVSIVSSTRSQQIPVTLTVSPVAAAALTLGEIGSFECTGGGAAPGTKSVPVGSTGGSLTYTAAAASQGNWLSVSPASGATPGSLTISVDPRDLAPGIYTGTITVSATGATSQSRTVTLTVRAPPVLAVSSSTLEFTWHTDGPRPVPRTVNIECAGGALQYTASSNVPWIVVDQPAGVTPGSLRIMVDPAGLSPGSHSGQVSVATIGASPASAAAVQVKLTITAPLPTVAAIVNAASNAPGPVAPGQIVTLYGTSMGSGALIESQLDETGRMASLLDEVRILFNGTAAPLVYVSAGQAAAIVPYSLAGRTAATVWLEYRGVRSNSVTVDVAASRPGLFTADSSGAGPGAILNQDYSLNSASNPAERGSVVMLYVTGEGQTRPAGVDGRINNDLDNLPSPALPVTVAIDGQPANVIYAGAAPNMVSGLMQLNVEVPAEARSGAVPVVVTVGGASSRQDVTIAVR